MRPVRLLLAVLAALSLTTPAAGQFRKIKEAATQKAAEKAGEKAGAPAAPAPSKAAPAPAEAGGGTVALTTDVVDRMVRGLKAAKAEREKALQEDTPYGRYNRAKAAAAAAKPKCQAAQATWGQRAAADEKLVKRYSAAMDKAMAAQQKGDMTGYSNATYEALGIIDPSCAVKDPETPDGYYEMERAVDERANQATLRTAGMTDREFGMASDKAIAILSGSEPPGGASASEKSAVSARDPELKSLLGIRSAQEERVAKQAPAPAPAPVAAPAQPPMPAYNECMVNNVKKHEKEIQALGDRGSAAQEAGNTALMMAIADSIQRLQMAGCNK